MITILACCFLFVLVCIILNYYVAYKNALNELVVYSDEIKLQNLILFSNEDIANAIAKRFENGEKFVKIYYFDKQYIKINYTENEECIKLRIEGIQDSLIEKAYLKLHNPLITSKVDEEIMNVWLNYGYNRRYRKIFRTEIGNMLDSKKISDSTYNAIYRRFYKFKKTIN